MANLPIKLSGSYQAPKGDIDALHSFDKRKSDKWGGYMLSGNPPAKYASKIKLDQGKGINQVLLELANQGIKPDVKSIKIKVNADYSVQWEAIIDKSTDGKAYIGVSSRGSGGGGADSRAIGQLPDLKKNNPNCCNWTVVLDFNISKPFNIRQFFIKYTLCKAGEKPNDIKVDDSKSSKNAELTPKNQETENGVIKDSTSNDKKTVADVTVPVTAGTPSIPFKDTILVKDELYTPVKYLDGEYIFNVESDDYFIHNGDIGSLLIIGKGEIYENTEDQEVLDAEYTEGTFAGAEETFPGAEELAFEFVIASDLQSQPFEEDVKTSSESLSTVSEINIDFNSSKFVGGKWKSFNIDKLLNSLSGYKPTKFKDSCKKVLYFIKNDKSIDDVRKAAYLLATAYAESGYSLQRWEADYVCTGAGVKYGPSGPCQSALNYYRSSKGKKNYYTLGTDSKGFPYFGRGLIQLTGKANYQKYGDLIGVNLVGNGDLAIQEDNSYKIASIYMTGRVFSHVIKGDLTTARKRVNGGTKGLSEVNGAYKAWLDAFNKIGVA